VTLSLLPAAPLLGAGGTQQGLPRPLVYLRDVDETILQDIRYAGSDNFTGGRVPGYEAGECILTRTTAEALARVQRDLAARRLTLKVYDCYRPVRAVQAFVAWTQSAGSRTGTARFYPAIRKSSLLREGYIARQSSHSRGNAIDLTLVEVGSPSAAPFAVGTNYGPCTGPAATRAPDNSVDMGTGYDCFDTKSHTASSKVDEEQRRWRNILTEAMQRQGFENFAKEWWHFTYGPGNAGMTFDVPVTAPPKH
jgi:D-alanyl-D-alanine dipeptidase